MYSISYQELCDRLQGTPCQRRAFLRGLAAASAALAAPSWASAAEAPAAVDQAVVGKDPRLILHAAFPAVIETPPALLIDERPTPARLLFVRNNQQPPKMATLAAVPAAGWMIEITGAGQPRSIDAGQLAALEQVDQEMVLQCSGNGRALFAPAAPVKGTPWLRGGMGNVRFAGPKLATVLDHFGIKPPAVRYLTAEGRDEPPPGEQDFEHSIPLDEALTKSLLALSLNGQPLPAIHGGPVRLVTPGYYGTMHVKWLSRLSFTADESNHTSQVPHYRTPLEPIAPGTPFTATYANSEPNWRMKIKSVVLSPAPDARLAADEQTIRGVAFNDGASPIAAVLVSVDAGATWQPAQLTVPKSPYAWYRWQIARRLEAGKHEIRSLAIDALGRSQPLDGAIHWNPSGYTWNGVEKIDVTVG